MTEFDTQHDHIPTRIEETTMRKPNIIRQQSIETSIVWWNTHPYTFIVICLTMIREFSSSKSRKVSGKILLRFLFFFFFSFIDGSFESEFVCHRLAHFLSFSLSLPSPLLSLSLFLCYCGLSWFTFLCAIRRFRIFSRRFFFVTMSLLLFPFHVLTFCM